MKNSRIISLLALAVSASLSAGHAKAAKAAAKTTEPAVEFVREGFCIKQVGTECNEVVFPGIIIDMRKLPKLPDGTPILYFYSQQKINAKTTFAQIVEAEDVDAHIDYLSPERGIIPEGPLKKSLQAMVKKLALDDGAIVTAYHYEGPNGQPGTTTYIPVTVPGAYHARIVDLKGDPIPGSSKITVSIIRRQ